MNTARERATRYDARVLPAGSLTPDAIFARDFQVIRPIAQGGMGAVYLVRQLSTGKERALKVMLPALVTDARSRERFVLEARAGASIESDHIVEIVAAGVDDPTGSPWIAMEYLRGETLADAVERGALAPGSIVPLLSQLRHAIGAAHAVGLVHRDLKPENIFLAVPRRAGVPFTLKVLDFGIAKFLDAGASARSTSAVGSPLWMSPEQANAQPVTASADVWALGLIAFWLFTHRIYWKSASSEHATISSILTEILVDPIEPPTQRAARLGAPANALPPGFDGWFAACVDREPSRRFREGGAALDALIEGVSRAFGGFVASGPGYAPPPYPTANPGNPSASHITPTSIAPTIAQPIPVATPSPFLGGAMAPAPPAPPARRWGRYGIIGVASVALSVVGGLAIAQFVGDEEAPASTSAAAPSIAGLPTNGNPPPPLPLAPANPEPVPFAPRSATPVPPSDPNARHAQPPSEPIEPAQPTHATGAPPANARRAAPSRLPSVVPAAPSTSVATPTTVASATRDAGSTTPPPVHDAGTTATGSPATIAAPTPSANTDDDWRYNGGPDPALRRQAIQTAQEVVTRCWTNTQRRDPHHAEERTDVAVSIGVVERAYATEVPGIEDRLLRWCIQADMGRAQFPLVRRPFTFRFRVTLTPD